MAEFPIDNRAHGSRALDRTVNLAAISWSAIAWTLTIVIGALFRFLQLGENPLSSSEAQLAHAAYRFYYGQTTGPGNALPDTGPAATLLESLAFFLFGPSDAAARLIPALLGAGMVALAYALRPLIGNGRALGMAALLALSPTAVYLSRLATNEIFVAATSLLALVALLRIGAPEATPDGRRFWAIVGGSGLAAAFGSGPSSLTVLLSIAVAAVMSSLFDTRPENAFRCSLRALRESRGDLSAATVAFAVTLAIAFTKLFSDFSGLSGLGETIADWGRLLTTASSPTPTQFFLLAVLLYEILAVAFAIVAASKTPAEPQAAVPWSFFALWFAVGLLVFSFSSGSLPEHAIHVALPVILLGGSTLGELVERLDVTGLTRGRVGLLSLTFVGIAVAVIAELILLGRIRNADDQTQATYEAIATLLLAVAPLGYGTYLLIKRQHAAGARSHAGFAALMAVLVLLGLYTFRSTVVLSQYSADEGAELLAQRTSTPAVRQIVRSVSNLSRDATLPAGDAADPEGGHGLSIAIARSAQWPFRWYFRDFPGAVVVADAQAAVSGAQVVIAPVDAGMADAGYAPTLYPTQNRVPAPYLAPDFGEILRTIFVPSNWEDGFRYLLFRTLEDRAEPEPVVVGFTAELANRISPDTGPFGLLERVGAGTGRGQFNQPRDIAFAAGGERTYVVDMGNARVQYFTIDGEVVDIWGAGDDPDFTLAQTDSGLGPTGITVGIDGLVYICDTWNHRVLVVDQSGRLVREFGSFADTVDSPDPSVQPGLFFGPRDVAIANDEIFVVDTGNERVQVFALDGTFLRAFGGHGNGPTHLIEPVGIAIGPDGLIYVADSGNARISIFTTSGTPVAQWAVDAWFGVQYFEPYLAFDSDGMLYASSSATGSVEVFDEAGNLVDAITEVNGEPLEEPIGLAWSDEGALYITDKVRHAVFRYTPPGPAAIEEEFPEVIEELPEASPSPVIETTPDEIAPASPAIDDEATPAASPAASPVASPIASPVVVSPIPAATATPSPAENG
jgi:uncharacterized protein (TIGR03663 family)